MRSASVSPPAPLTVAASLVAVEGVVLVVLAVLEAVSISDERLMLGVTTTLFFVCYGAGLLWCAVGLRRRRTWARGPVLLTQLIQLGVAWGFWGGDRTWLVVVLVVAAVVTAAGVIHPASTAALEGER